MVEEARLESVYTPKGYRGFESPSLRLSGDLCLVEWPEKIEQLLPENVMTVRITVDSDTARTFEID